MIMMQYDAMEIFQFKANQGMVLKSQIYYKGAPNTSGVLQTLPHYKKILSRDLRLKEFGVFGTETVLTFPSCLFIGMMRPLDLEKFDRLVASLTLSFFKNSHWVLMIR